MVSKKILLGIGIVAVFAVVLFTVKGFPPTREGTEGAIGAAKRYQTEQISSDDVVLQDAEVQALLQTDFFHKLVTDKDFQKLVADGVGARMTVDSFGRLTPQEIDGLQAAFKVDGFGKALYEGDVQKAAAIADANGIKAVNVDALGKLNYDGFGRLTPAELDGLEAAFKVDGFGKAVYRGDIGRAAAIADANGIKAINVDALGKLNYDGFGRLTPAELDGLGAAFKVDGFGKAVYRGDLGRAIAIADANGIKAVNVDALGKLTYDGFGRLTPAELDGLGAAYKVDGFGKAMYMGDVGRAAAIADANGIKAVNVDALGKVAYEGLGRLTPAEISGLGAAFKVDGFGKAVYRGDLGRAIAIADANGIKAVNVDALGKLTYDGFGRLTPQEIDGLQAAFEIDGFGKAVFADDLGRAAAMADANGIKAVDIQTLGKLSVDTDGLNKSQIDALGRLLAQDGVWKMTAYSDGFGKLTADAGFRSAVASGDLGKFMVASDGGN